MNANDGGSWLIGLICGELILWSSFGLIIAFDKYWDTGWLKSILRILESKQGDNHD